MSEVKIPEGYKQTEVGIIPEDWGLSDIKSISLIPTQNGLFYEPKRKGFGVPLINVSDMYKSAPIEVNFLELFDAIPSEIDTFKVIAGDLLFTRSSIVPSGIAFCNIFESNRDDVVFDSHLIKVRPNSNIINPRFLYLNCVSNHSRKALISEAKTATMTTIDQAAINRCPVLLPPIKEQTAIATALSDVDNLIGSLEKLIAKKQAIKTGTMQQLLTGKTRLPEFATREDGSTKGFKQTELGQIPEDWDLVSVDACSSKVGSGKTPTGGSSVYVTSGRPFIRSQNVGWGELKLSDVAYITDEVHQTFLGSEIESSDVLLNITGASIGRCTKADARIAGGNVNQHVCIVRTNQNKLTPKILVELINSDIGQKQIDSYQAGGNREGLNFKQVRQLKFAISDDINEQIAIATILSDIDTEIQALQQRLDKIRDIKQGMMQQLLTGKVRLAH